tara:strand:+ start:368 stop:541 length:174 start_codon:yes stop_codon:yes gene_type:complete
VNEVANKGYDQEAFSVMLKQLKGNELDALNIDNWTLAELQKAVKQFKVIEDMKQTDT